MKNIRNQFSTCTSARDRAHATITRGDNRPPIQTATCRRAVIPLFYALGKKIITVCERTACRIVICRLPDGPPAGKAPPGRPSRSGPDEQDKSIMEDPGDGSSGVLHDVYGKPLRTSGNDIGRTEKAETGPFDQQITSESCSARDAQKDIGSRLERQGRNAKNKTYPSLWAKGKYWPIRAS